MRIQAKYLHYTVYIVGVSLKGIATCVYPVDEQTSRLAFIPTKELTIIDKEYIFPRPVKK